MDRQVVRVVLTSVALAALSFTTARGATAHEAATAPSVARGARLAPVGDDHDHRHHASATAAAYTRSVQSYAVPELSLVGADGQPVALRALFDTDKPVLVNFVFTSCNAICPVMTATFAQLQERLGERRGQVRLVSVSIDPEQDTPARLREYAGRFHAGADWHFLTGGRDDIIRVQTAFDAFRGNKTNHTPLTFLRTGARAPWVRFEGFASAEQLLQEVARAATP
jgi:protein SCO1/2